MTAKPALPKRDRTRRQIMDAALGLFAGQSYSATTVDAICAEAGIVRATFYRHFDDKAAVAAALVDELMPQVWDMWARLARLPGTDAASLAQWLRDFLALAAQRRAYFVMMREIGALRNYGFPWQVRQRIVDILAEGKPGFALARPDPEGDPELRALVYLHLLQVNEFLFATEIQQWTDGRGPGVTVLSRALASLFETLARAASRETAG
jgi:AcrR family transcriptional regulator